MLGLKNVALAPLWCVTFPQGICGLRVAHTFLSLFLTVSYFLRFVLAGIAFRGHGHVVVLQLCWQAWDRNNMSMLIIFIAFSKTVFFAIRNQYFTRPKIYIFSVEIRKSYFLQYKINMSMLIIFIEFSKTVFFMIQNQHFTRPKIFIFSVEIRK